jgi:hypothetical protein
MATLIPSLGSCVSRMTTGERRLAERLEDKLDDDYLLWYDIPIGPQRIYPDFLVLHPRRGLLVLETKHWHIDTIRDLTRQDALILSDGHYKTVVNPLVQARHGALHAVDVLSRDKALVQGAGSHQGKLLCPWGYGVVFTRITRKQFDEAGFAEAIESHLCICADEMTDTTPADAFQQRLWDMFPYAFGEALTLPQIDRVRWTLFPEIRTTHQAVLLEPDAEPPDVVRVMDLQQEQLARSLGDGHRVVHGVAGSGKTMILGYRAEHLAKAGGPESKPILVLCYNEPLAIKLEQQFAARGLSASVQAVHFHKWCRRQLVAFGQTVPEGQGPAVFEAMVDGVIRAVQRGQIPAGQYRAVLIDEGHDFRPEWLKLVVQMVDPLTKSLLVLYDDAQSIYERRHNRQFSFKSVGIDAQGRTTILKINYRNTRQILSLAHRIAADVLSPEERDDDGVPLLAPIGSGREGAEPQIVRLPTRRDEARATAQFLIAQHGCGRAWNDMAVLCPDFSTLDMLAAELKRRKLPVSVRKKVGQFTPELDSIKLMTLRVSKGLEFPVVAMPGLGDFPKAGEDETDAARLFYVGVTRATDVLFLSMSAEGAIAKRLAAMRVGSQPDRTAAAMPDNRRLR